MLQIDQEKAKKASLQSELKAVQQQMSQLKSTKEQLTKVPY